MLPSAGGIKFALPISPQSTTPVREGLAYFALTVPLTWLFWVPGALLPMGSAGSELLLSIGSLAPLGVAVFLDVWLQTHTLSPLNWLRTLSLRAVIVPLLLPIMLLIPMLMLRQDQGTLFLTELAADARGMWLGAVWFLVLALVEEVGWRGYLLPRLKGVPIFAANLAIGIAWFIWQLPLVLAGRYNESENFAGFVFAMFLYALLITPFFNRLASRVGYNPIPPAIARGGISFAIAVYYLQGRADPLTDTFGLLMLLWLAVLNLILFSQLWQGKKPPAQISELERVMPLETT